MIRNQNNTDKESEQRIKRIMLLRVFLLIGFEGTSFTVFLPDLEISLSLASS